MARNERSFRTSALIIKRREFGEADRLLTVLTPEHGKRSVIAKGVRKPTSHKAGHVELFTQVDALINRGRELDILTQVETIQPYLPLREDLSRGAYASYAGELADRFTYVGDDDLHAVFQVVAEAFDRLCTADDPRLVVRYYEVHLLGAAGFRPELNNCVFTHEPIEPVDQYFSFAEGGVVSPSAAQYAPSRLPISLDALKLLRHMQRSPFSQVASLRLPQPLHNEVERLLLGYITYLLERQLQSVDFIRRVRTT